VVTNQAGIARGYYDIPTFHAFMDHMRAELAAGGAHLDAVYFCPFHPDGVNEFRGESECRKPRPGMILQAIDELHLDPARCLLVGDFESDVEAAQNAGIEGYLFPGGDLLEFMEANRMFRFGQ
jgi:D-glycero-D-manno-heptose 1,7-bisphosphate phosphatase